MDSEQIKSIASASLPHAVSLLRDWFPLGKQSGKEFTIGNLAGAPGKSLGVNINTGAWNDMATGEKGGDLVSLLAAKEGISQSKAAESLASRIVFPVSNRETSVAVADYTVLPVAPADAPPPPKHRQYGAATRLWHYRNQSGATVGYVCRFDTPQGKQYAPIAWCRNGTGEGWQFKAFGRPRPLYRLELLADAKDEVILIVEGEKTADAAQKLFPEIIVMSWPGGAQAVNYADWTPLKGKRVIIWPDNDQPGKDAAAKISALVEGSRVVKLPGGLSDGWDLADELPDRVDIHALVAVTLSDKSNVLGPVEILATVADPSQYRLASGFLGKGHINCLIGVGGCGKSRIAVHLAHTHAAGLPKWFNLELRGHPAKWLFVGAENDNHRVKTDLQGLSGVFNTHHRGIAYPLLRWLNPDNDESSNGGYLDVPASKTWLLEAIKREQPHILVLDTLASMCLTLNLNADEDMRTACAHVKDLMKAGAPGCTALIIHHAKPGSENITQALNNYSGGGYGRNSKVLSNISRADMLVMPGDADDESRLVIKVGKLNNGVRFQPFGIKFNGHSYESDHDFDLSAYADDVKGLKSGNKVVIVDVVRAMREGLHTRKAIVEAVKAATGGKERSVDMALRKAQDAGYIEKIQPFGSFGLTKKADTLP